MGLIHVLDTEVSNKIAAGEVVERPQSIVKELIENSIDAGANVITVEIKGGGISYIRITDNGSGMSAEDARICFLRHATSKIKTGEDLDAIYTLGFRGEALSSIGAVAKVRLYTRQRGADTGICVTCEGGEILSSDDAGAPNGTVMEVTDLFYNTPARLKFLKKSATEAGYIQDTVTRCILAHPEISFKLIRDGKEILFSSGDNKLINAVYAVYGRDYAKNMLDVDYEFNGVRVTGVIGKGTLTRANRNYENFFVNGRYIRSGIMMRALEEAYKNQIMISKFPTAILNVEVDARSVDINVHPTKLECKFTDERLIYQSVYHAAKAALYALPNVPELEKEEKPAEEEKPSVFTPDRGEQRSLEEIYNEKLRRSSAPQSEFKFKTEERKAPLEFSGSEPKPEERKEPPRTERPAAIPQKPAAIPERARAEAEQTYDDGIATNIVSSRFFGGIDGNTFAMLDAADGEAGKKKKIGVKEPKQEPVAEQTEELIFDDGYFRVAGQVFDTYIIVEKDERMLIIDQHAAHERLNYEALKQELETRGVTSQMLLMPVDVKLTATEAEMYRENEKLFSELGFEAQIDGDTVIISAVPGDIAWSDTEPLFMELLTCMGDMKNDIITERKQRLLYTISCKAAIKANMKLSEKEMTELVRRVFALKNINTCPHGRPIVISMTKKEIEKDFKRIV